MIGKIISHYRIVEKLGEGGMGVVYKARDTHLERFVALKILPAKKVVDPERKRRFVQEARAASSLNHPHIVTIHDIDEADGVHFIAMEYLDGRTLDQMILRHGMGLNDALKVAVQIADALGAAHAAGIVHRDLKPANVMVSQSGLVKVLDFGLAKLAEKPESSSSDAQTLQAGSERQTEEGTILGTVSYMSPEQAEGKKVDARSDIFSFGSVLYEMVTGQRAFQGDSKMSTLAAILNKDPKPVRSLSDALPYDLEKIVTRCLRKALDRRWQNMADLKVALEELKEESDSGTLVTVSSPPSVRRRGVWTAGLVALLCVVAVTVWALRSTQKQPLEVAISAVPLTSYPGSERSPNFSPDGNQVVFSWDGEKQDNFDIYVKLIGSGTQLRLTKAPEADTCPVWSPDGSFIAFLREKSSVETAVLLVSPLGPPERKVAVLSPTTSWSAGVAWTPDGKSLVVTDRNSDSEPSGLFFLSVESGEKRRLTSPSDKRFVDTEPAFSPDGRTLAFSRDVALGVRDIYLLALSEDFHPIGEPQRLTFENRITVRPVWTPDGREVIFSSGPYLSPNLFRIAASGSGKPQRLVGVGEDGSELAVSHRKQRLVYTRELANNNIWRLELPGLQGKISRPVKLISSTRAEGDPQFSRDGKRIAFNSNRAGTVEIWICDSDGSNAQQLTSEGSFCGSPHWSPDDERIAFDSILNGQWEVFVTSVSGGKPKPITSNPASDWRPTWSGDGKWIYFASNRSGTYEIWKIAADGGEAAQLTQAGGLQAIESPDSQFLYYTKSRGATALWKMPHNGGEETQVLESVNEQEFDITGKGIYFIAAPNSAAPHSIQFLDFTTKALRSIATLERSENCCMSVSPDGRWLLFDQVDQSGSDLMLVENFR